MHKGESGQMLSLHEYEETYLALGVCVEANVPVILWGPPGQGKTSVIRALAEKSERHLFLPASVSHKILRDCLRLSMER